jgi:hypothetical protein
MNCPGWHAVRAMQEVAGLRSSSQCSESHSRARASPPGQKLPDAQREQLVLVAPDCCVFARVPGGHVPIGMHSDRFAIGAYVPTTQGAQARSVDSVGALSMNVPAGHADQGRQLGELSSVLNVPAGHAPHLRSELAEPGVITRVPGRQLVHSTQRESPGAENVPSAQYSGPLEPPPAHARVKTTKPQSRPEVGGSFPQ